MTSEEATTEPDLVWAPEPLTPAQRSGRACVACAKVWPRPRARVGVLGEPAEAAAALFDAPVTGVEQLGTPGSPLYACEECAPLIGAAQP